MKYCFCAFSLALSLVLPMYLNAAPPKTMPITFIRARSVGNSTDIARMVLYVRVPDQAKDPDIEKAIALYAQQERKRRAVDELTVWVDLEAAKDCEKLSGKPYLSYTDPTKTKQMGFSSRPAYLEAITALRAKGSCRPLY